MKPTIHLIHGIRDDGTHTTEVLSRLLARDEVDRNGDVRTGWNVKPHKLPRTHTWHAASSKHTKDLAETLLNHIQLGDHLVCHSHGCNIGWEIMRLAAKTFSGPYISKFVALAPAMGRKQDFSEVHFDKLLCLHNPMDFAIWAGSSPLLPSIRFPFITLSHPFGMAGAMGFSTEDLRVLNEARVSFVGPFNHTSPYFQEPYVEEVENRIDDFLRSDV